MSSYGIFLLVLLLYQRRNRILFSVPTASPKTHLSAGNSPKQGNRSFSFGDEISPKSSPNQSDEVSLSSRGERGADTESCELLRRSWSHSSNDAALNCRSSELASPNDLDSFDITDSVKSSLENSNASNATLESDIRLRRTTSTPNSSANILITDATISSKGNNSFREKRPPKLRAPSAIAQNSYSKGQNKYNGSNNWKKVQQQLDYGSGVADKLLWIMRGPKVRRNSKTKPQKVAIDHITSEICLTPQSTGSDEVFPDAFDFIDEASILGPRGRRVAADNISSMKNFFTLHNMNLKAKSENALYSMRGDIDGDTELGNLLIDFLEFYGEDWENEKVGFSVRDGGFKFNLENSVGTPSHPQADDPFVIEDPVNVMNNVAKSCYNVAGVMRAIQGAYNKYRACVVKPTSSGNPSSPRRDVTDLNKRDLANNEYEVSEIIEVGAADSHNMNESTIEDKNKIELRNLSLTPLDVENEEDVKTHDVKVGGKSIFAGSVRSNIKTRATSYMQLHNKVPTNSPVNPIKKLDQIESIVSEVSAC